MKREIAIRVDVKVDCLAYADEVILLFIGQQSVRVVPYDVEQLPLLLLLLALCQLLGQASHADVLIEVWHFSLEVDPACRDLRLADLSSREELKFFLHCLACDLLFLIADAFPAVVDSLSNEISMPVFSSRQTDILRVDDISSVLSHELDR